MAKVVIPRIRAELRNQRIQPIQRNLTQGRSANTSKRQATSRRTVGLSMVVARERLEVRQRVVMLRLKIVVPQRQNPPQQPNLLELELVSGVERKDI